MHVYGSLADDYYVNMNLNTEMKLPDSRETILDFFGRVQKSYPEMRNFYTRENGDFVLEEDKEHGHQRWLSVEPRRVSSAYLNPADPEAADEQHLLVLELVPYMLSVSPLDCEALDYMLVFDFSYCGNHDALVAEALGAGGALEGMFELPGAQVLNYEPSMTISLEESCRTQARIMIETRTNAYQVRRGEFADDQISVYFTVRQYGSLQADDSFEKSLMNLKAHAENLLDSFVVGHVLRPLAQAIATK